MKEIPLTQGKVALVDDEDYEYLTQWKWCYNRYAVRCIGPKNHRQRIAMHQVILNPPEGLETDHIDRNKLNNQRSNLRAVTRSENMQNKAPYMQGGILITPGVIRKRRKRRPYSYVYWCTRLRKFRVILIVDGKRKRAGAFVTRQDPFNTCIFPMEPGERGGGLSTACPAPPVHA